ncbi:MAG TPA: hypothetical protein VEW03_03995 [Longimicrobiaceae bacterium]|nr:hypothetical protein [Longimicrobiaceae bacterium]
MKTKTQAGLLAALAAVSMATAAGAQICVGFPTGDRQFTLGVGLLFPQGAQAGDVWHVEGSANPLGPLGLFGSVTFFDDGLAGAQSYAAGVAWELVPVAPAGACPTASVENVDLEGVGTAFAIPVGIGFGADVPMSRTVSLNPYLVPAVIFSRFDPDDGLFPGADSESETDFGVSGGVVVSFRTFFFGGTVQHVFDGDSDPTFGVRAGIRL